MQIPKMYYGWNIVAVSIVFQAVSYGLTYFVFSFWAEAWMNEFNSDRTQVNFIFMVYNLAMGIYGAILGRMLDKYSIRMLIISGAFLLACGFVLISLATTIWQITLMYVTLIPAAGVLLGPPAAQTLAAKWFRARRGLAIGWGSIGTSIGGLLMPPIITYLVLSHGWRAAHQALAGIALLFIVPLAWKIIRNTPEERGIEPEPAGHFDLTDTEQLTNHWTTRKVLGERNYWIPIIAFFPAFAAFTTIQANLRLYTTDLGIDAQNTAFLMSLMAGIMILGKLFFGAMADRIDQRLLYWITALLLELCMILLIGRPSYFFMIIICSLMGFAVGGFMPLLGAIIGSRFGPQAYGQVFGMIYPFLTLSSLAPLLGGWIRDTTGSYDAIFQIILVVLIPAMIAMAFMKRQEVAVSATAG